MINPAVHFGVSGAGKDAWFGWPDIPQLQKLTTDWVRTSDQTKRKQIADEIQKVAFSEWPTCRGVSGSCRQPSARTSRGFSSSRRRCSGV